MTMVHPQRVRRWFSSVALAVGLLVACHRDARDTDPPATSAALEDALTLRLEALGDRGVVLIVAQPQHWPALRGVLASFEGREPGWQPRLGEGKDLITTALRIASDEHRHHLVFREPPPERGDGKPRPPGPPHCLWDVLGRSANVELAGIDATRPIALSLFEPPIVAPTLGVVAAMSPSGSGLDGLVHRASIPATDPDALVASLALRLGTATEFPALVEGRRGARAFRIATDWVALLPGTDAVGVVALTDAVGSDPETMLPRWRARLDVPPKPLPDTPARRALVDPTAAIAAVVRPWYLRNAIEWSSMQVIEEIVPIVGYDQRAHARARGLGITLRGIATLVDEQAELDDWTFAVRADAEAVHARVVASLAPRGRAIVDAAKVRGAPLHVKTANAATNLFVGIDFATAITQAETHAALARPGVLGDLPNCGNTCIAQLAMRQPLSTLRAMVGAQPVPVTRVKSTRGMQLVTVEDEVGREQRAFAILKSEPTTPADAEALVELVKWLSSGKVQAHAVTHGNGSALLFGFGIDPRTIFDTETTVDVGDALATFELGGRLPLPGEMSAARGMTARGRVSRVDDALVADIVLAKPRTHAFAELPTFAGLRWDSPIATMSPTSAQLCLRAAATPIGRWLDDLGRKPEGATLAGMQTALAELDCAAKDPGTADIVRTLRREVAGITAAVFARIDTRKSIAVLDWACTSARDEASCARRDALEHKPLPEPRVVDLAPECDMRDIDPSHGVTATFAGDRVWLDDRPVPLEQGAIGAALAKIWKSDHAGDEPPTVAILAAKDVRASQVSPLLAALATWGSSNVGVIVDARGRGRLVVWSRLALGLPETVPTEDDDGMFRYAGRGDLERWVDIGREGIELRLDADAGDPRNPLDPPQKIAKPTALRDKFDGAKTMVRFAPTVQWSQVVDVLVAVCPDVTITDRPTK